MELISNYGVDEIDSEDVSLIDLETGLPLIVSLANSQKIELKEGDKIKATIVPTLCTNGLPNCFGFKDVQKI